MSTPAQSQTVPAGYPEGDRNEPAPVHPRAAVTASTWSNYARRVDLVTTVIATILDMLSQNPMIAPAIGEDFVREATEVSRELRALQEEASRG